MIVVRRGRPRDRARHAQEFNDLVRALMSPRGVASPHRAGTWRPPIDVYETPESITIVAEIAGMQREAIEVVIEGEIVSLRGNRPDPHVCDHRAFHEAHIAYGEFAADVFIPHNIDTDQASATYENGFLIVELPRLQGRTIVPTTTRDATGDTRSDA